MANNIDIPWILLGDFNVTLFSEERLRNGVVIPHDTSELVHFIQETDLADLKFSCMHLTWCNHREGEENVL